MGCCFCKQSSVPEEIKTVEIQIVSNVVEAETPGPLADVETDKNVNDSKEDDVGTVTSTESDRSRSTKKTCAGVRKRESFPYKCSIPEWAVQEFLNEKNAPLKPA